MKNHYALPVLILGLMLGSSGPASAQTSMQKMLDNLAGRKPAAPATAQIRESDTRLIEILVELAWLGDTVTFPFYLEARVEGPNLQLRGNVPSKAVHDHAVKMAQMNSPLPVADVLKENSLLKVHPTRMTPDQLEKVVRASLRESLPRQAKNLQTRCTADGQVAVKGIVESFEQKLTVSQVLRRLHGCTVVINLTTVTYDPQGDLARMFTQPKVNPVVVPPTVVAQGPGTSTTDVVKSSPLVLPGPPADIIVKADPTSVPPAVKKDGPRLTLPQIQKRIQEACPKAKEVRVSMKLGGDIKVEIHIRDEADIEATFNRVYSIADLESYHLDVGFIVGAPTNPK
jgi:BON domain